jgi:cysteinyl-tRNA synthetase
MCAALGLTLGSVAKVDDGELALANTKAAALDAARAAKDFAKADALRAELQSAGWLVETTKQGTTLRRA